ncbi:glutamate-gated kainate-type ion channel receptor subunit GluR17 [Trifolium pratense]|uniref:Glutamate-gated kainate-type ion channel receptor subunit GluR17 n=1 Tax=Trifolium pratense TaxID=57577 RepID=A0A2K3M766_TRIPR|nr:glutamate-gated kainate-type ion channel receptor subunit GluR17 [Trifolium pratense]
MVREFNLALLGKWCWRLLVDKEGLWFRVLTARYGVEGGKSVSKKVGDGSDTLFWIDTWLGDNPLCGGGLEVRLGFEGGGYGRGRRRCWGSVRPYYFLFLCRHIFLTGGSGCQILSLVSILAWRLLRDRLPTKTNLVTRGLISVDVRYCVSGCGDAKSAHHLFLTCGFFGSLWPMVQDWIGSTAVDANNLHDHFVRFTQSVGGQRSRRSFMQLIWLACV